MKYLSKGPMTDSTQFTSGDLYPIPQDWRNIQSMSAQENIPSSPGRRLFKSCSFPAVLSTSLDILCHIRVISHMACPAVILGFSKWGHQILYPRRSLQRARPSDFFYLHTKWTCSYRGSQVWLSSALWPLVESHLEPREWTSKTLFRVGR